MMRRNYCFERVHPWEVCGNWFILKALKIISLKLQRTLDCVTCVVGGTLDPLLYSNCVDSVFMS